MQNELLRLSETCNNKATSIRFSQQHGLLHQHRQCGNGHNMTLCWSTISRERDNKEVSTIKGILCDNNVILKDTLFLRGHMPLRPPLGLPLGSAKHSQKQTTNYKTHTTTAHAGAVC